MSIDAMFDEDDSNLCESPDILFWERKNYLVVCCEASIRVYTHDLTLVQRRELQTSDFGQSSILHDPYVYCIRRDQRDHVVGVFDLETGTYRELPWGSLRGAPVISDDREMFPDIELLGCLDKRYLVFSVCSEEPNQDDDLEMGIYVYALENGPFENGRFVDIYFCDFDNQVPLNLYPESRTIAIPVPDPGKTYEIHEIDQTGKLSLRYSLPVASTNTSSWNRARNDSFYRESKETFHWVGGNITNALDRSFLKSLQAPINCRFVRCAGVNTHTCNQYIVVVDSEGEEPAIAAYIMDV
jgi:hypothetical protein